MYTMTLSDLKRKIAELKIIVEDGRARPSTVKTYEMYVKCLGEPWRYVKTGGNGRRVMIS